MTITVAKSSAAAAVVAALLLTGCGSAADASGTASPRVPGRRRSPAGTPTSTAGTATCRVRPAWPATRTSTSPTAVTEASPTCDRPCTLSPVIMHKW